MNRKILILILPLVVLLFPFLMKLPVAIPIDEPGFGFGGDAVNTMYPWLKTSVTLISKGELPVWTPYEGLGRPLYSNIQAAPFYPPTWLLAFITGENLSFFVFQLYLLCHLGIGGLGIYFLAKNFELSLFSSFAAAIVFMGGGFFLGHISMLSIVGSLIWIPWLFLAWFKANKSNFLIWTPTFGIFCALSVLAGQPQPFYYALIILFSWLIVAILQNRTLKPLYVLAIGGAIALCLAAPSLLPGIRELPEMVRGQGGWESPVEIDSLPLQQALGVVAPHISNVLPAAVLYSVFFTITGLLLAISGVYARIKNRVYLLTGLFIGSVLAFANTIGLEPLLETVLPGMSFFKEHYRAGSIVLIFIAILAGKGFEKLADIHARNWKIVLLPALLIIAVNAWALANTEEKSAGFIILCTIYLLVAGIVLLLSYLKLKPTLVSVIVIVLLAAEVLYVGLNNNMHPGVPDMVQHRENLANGVPAETPFPARISWGPSYNLQTLDVAFGLNSLYSWDANQYRPIRRLWGLIEKHDRFLERFSVAYWRSAHQLSMEKRQPSELVLNNRNQKQVFRFDSPVHGNLFLAKVSADGPITGDTLSAVLKGEAEVLVGLEIQVEPNLNAALLQAQLPEDVHFSEMALVWLGEGSLRVNSIIVDDENIGLAGRFREMAPTVYELTDALPRVFLVPEIEYCRKEAQVAGKMISGRDIDETAVVVASDPPKQKPSHWLATDYYENKVEITDYSATRVKISADLQTPAVLVFNDYHHECWKAYLDEVSVPVLRANKVVRAVELPEGNHKIEFRYEDPLLLTGIIVWLLGVLAACTMIMIGSYRQNN
jgi:hypothetical protein